MSDTEDGGQAWLKWAIGILVTLVAGVAVPIYLASRQSAPTGPVATATLAVTVPTSSVGLLVPSPGPSGFDRLAPAHVYANPTSGAANSTVSVSGNGFQPRERVTFSFSAIEVGDTTADETGQFRSVAVKVPGDLRHFVGTEVDLIASGEVSLKNARTPFVISG